MEFRDGLDINALDSNCECKFNFISGFADPSKNHTFGIGTDMKGARQFTTTN